MVGTINTSAPSSTASFEVYGLLAGDDYEVMMSATSTDGETSCVGSALFDVTAGVATEVHVMLNCRLGQELGGVRVNGKFNFCAEIVKVVVSPLQTSVGNQIDVLAVAEDRDGDAIEYEWTGTGGSFADPASPRDDVHLRAGRRPDHHDHRVGRRLRLLRLQLHGPGSLRRRDWRRRHGWLCW